nr:PREDICTED: uncharacterized protein LOC105671768 [Linepithema humile]
MDTAYHIILLSALCITAIEYALNRSVIHSIWEELTINIWQDLAKTSEFIFTGCVVLLVATLIVLVTNIFLTPTTAKKVSHAILRSSDLTPSYKETAKVCEAKIDTKLKQVSPIKCQKGNNNSREPRRYIILLKDEN